MTIQKDVKVHSYTSVLQQILQHFLVAPVLFLL